MSITSSAIVVRFARRLSFARLLLSAGVALLLAATPAAADIEPLISAPIGPVIVVPGQPIDFFFGEVPDPIHFKVVTFKGQADTVPGAVSSLDVVFDWFNPSTNMFEFSTPFNFIVPGGQPTPIDVTWTIPYCPPEVSLHLVNVANAASVPIEVRGVFTYQCVPEPSTWALGAMALAGFAGYRLRRKFV